MKTPIIITLAAVLSTGIASAQGNKADIVDTAVKAGSFKTLVAAVQAAGLEEALRGEGPYTVFAPTDAAFAAIPKATLDSLLLPENKDKLQAILMYHVVAGSVSASEVVEMDSVETLNGSMAMVKVSDAGVKIGSAMIVTTDIQTSNGVIHVIDTVMIPAPMPDIVDLAASAGTFNTLLTAVKAAGLADVLRSEGPFTVLAPSDAAFAKIDPKTLASLLEEKNRDQLAAILKAHVVPAAVSARDAIIAQEASTVGGEKVRFSIKDGRMEVNGAKIIMTDLKAKNGIVHVIDSVLIAR